jgi:ribosome biogenesis GTPase / thiamine phosphate phosphatase
VEIQVNSYSHDSVHELTARVVEEQRGSYRLLSEDIEYLAELAGRLRHRAGARADLPAVGDWVRAVAGASGTGRAAVIHEVLPRWSSISRVAAGNPTEEQVLAANVDTAFIVTSLNLDLNPRRLERYVTLARNGGVTPVILLTKADLCAAPETAVTEVAAATPGVAVHAMSVWLGRGLDALTLYLAPGKTCVLLGSSGTGKSTIVNHLLGAEAQRVLPVRENDDRGRHATTHREMIPLPGGALLIDTPGLREIQLWNADENGRLEQAFEDIASLATACRFKDCQHQTEPGCAVKAAVTEGTLEPGRLASHVKLQRELAFLERKQDKRARSEHKKKYRAVNLAKRTERFR